MKDKILYLLGVIILGVLYYFSNSYINSLDAETTVIESQNRILQAEITELRDQYIADVVIYDDYNEYLSILPEQLKWDTIITQLDKIESKYNLEIIKTFENGLVVDSESKYATIPEEIEILGVQISIDTNRYVLNEYLKDIQNLPNLVVIDNIYVTLSENSSDLSADIYLLYFTYNENREE